MSEQSAPHEGPVSRFYEKVLLAGPVPAITLAVVLGVVGFFALHLTNFKMNASSDSITRENDPAMHLYNQISETFGVDDYVAVAFTPKGDMFSEKTLNDIRTLSEELSAIPSVVGVQSILTVPLFHSPDISLFQLATGYKTLGGGADPELVRKELLESPLFSDFIIAKDGTSTILQVNFEEMNDLNLLSFERFHLREKKKAREASKDELKRLHEVEEEYKRLYAKWTGARQEGIVKIREVLAKHGDEMGELRLGGVPMVVSDIVMYVKRDIALFGSLVLIFIFVMMGVIFRRFNFMLLPMMTCLMAVVFMMGYLGYMDWRTTIVTANFTSLLLIITTENAIHLSTQYRRLRWFSPELDNRRAIASAAGEVFKPCFYSTLTTMVGFGSLIVSGIRPVMDFGIMMTIGLGVSFVICFLFMPAGLALMPMNPEKLPPPPEVEAREAGTAGRGDEQEGAARIAVLARLTEKFPALVLGLTLVVFLVCAVGTRRLTVENRFFDYFRPSTDLYKGFVFIDQKLGGTTPIDIVIDGGTPEFWLDMANLEKLRDFHAWLDEQPETGKVVSLDTLMQVLLGIQKGKPVTRPVLDLLRKNIPPEMAASILRPYVSSDFQKVRISVRARESMEGLNRADLIARIEKRATEGMGFTAEQARVNGMFVLYNNMLQTLFGSQIKTVGTVLLTCWIVFSIVFRSFSLAFIGLVPNILSVTIILGLVGWSGIPLDMMTIMVAAITFGLADDNTIHYLHRFKEEFAKDRDYRATMYRCHNSVGLALSYSMITIVAGFSILTFSSFMPTVYFGIFTGIAIFLALLMSHTILPLLVLWFRPLGPQRAAIAGGEDGGEPASSER